MSVHHQCRSSGPTWLARQTVSKKKSLAWRLGGKKNNPRVVTKFTQQKQPKGCYQFTRQQPTSWLGPVYPTKTHQLAGLIHPTKTYQNSPPGAKSSEVDQFPFGGEINQFPSKGRNRPIPLQGAKSSREERPPNTHNPNTKHFPF